MGNRYAMWDISAKCPFYAGESAQKHTISCNEGVDDNSRLSMTFMGKDGTRRAYLLSYCCSEYQKCEVYKLLAKKWE